MIGIYRPRQSVRRLTPNAGNFSVIKGGKTAPQLPRVIGQPPATLNAQVGVPFTHNIAQYFTGTGTYKVNGTKPAWLNVNGTTGALTGTPDAAASWPNLKMQLQHESGLDAKTGNFSIVVAP